MAKTVSIFLIKAATLLLVVFLLLGSNLAKASVDCWLIEQIDLTTNKGVRAADNILNSRKVDKLCAFYVAWALQDKPYKARPYIARIKNILRKHEPFYYKALYLKLLLLDLTKEEIRRDFRKLDNAEPKLARKLRSESLKILQKDLQRLRNAPFNTTISTSNPWFENTKEKRIADNIMAWVKEIFELHNISNITKSNSEQILKLFEKLKQAKTNTTGNKIIAKHTDYVKYYNFMAKAENRRNEFYVRLNNVYEASELEKKYQLPNGKATKLYDKLKFQIEVNNFKIRLNILVQQLKRHLRPSELNLDSVRNFWGNKQYIADALTDKGDKGFLELLRHYDECYNQKKIDFCKNLVDWPVNKSDHLSTKDSLKGFKKDAQTILQQQLVNISTQINEVIVHEVKYLKTKLDELVQQLKKHRSPSELNLDLVRNLWGEKQYLTKELTNNDNGFIELLRHYDECYNQKKINFCEKLVNWVGNKYDHLNSYQLRPFKKEAKVVLKQQAIIIAEQIEAIIRNDIKRKISQAYSAASQKMRDNEVLLKYLPEKRYKKINNKIKILLKIWQALYKNKDSTEILRLSKSIGVTDNFEELRQFSTCKIDQAAINETITIVSIYNNKKTAIKDCQIVLGSVNPKCKNAIKSTRFKLIKTVAKKIVDNAVEQLINVSANKVRGVITETIKNLAQLISKKIIIKKGVIYDDTINNNCKAEPPLDSSVLKAKRFFENLKILHEQRKNYNLGDIGGLLAYPNATDLINIDDTVKKAIAKAISNPRAKPDTKAKTLNTSPRAKADTKARNPNTSFYNISTTPTTSSPKRACWSWERSAFRYMLVSNDKLRQVYFKFFTEHKKYPYFVAGMKVWKGKANVTDYSDTTLRELAAAVKILSNGIDNDFAIYNANFNAFVESVKETLTPQKIEADRKKENSTRGSKLNRARFVRAFFLGLWHLERQEYQQSIKVIKDAFSRYRYDRNINHFFKQLIGYKNIKSAINDLKLRLQEID